MYDVYICNIYMLYVGCNMSDQYPVFLQKQTEGYSVLNNGQSAQRPPGYGQLENVVSVYCLHIN